MGPYIFNNVNVCYNLWTVKELPLRKSWKQNSRLLMWRILMNMVNVTTLEGAVTLACSFNLWLCDSQKRVRVPNGQKAVLCCSCIALWSFDVSGGIVICLFYGVTVQLVKVVANLYKGNLIRLCPTGGSCQRPAHWEIWLNSFSRPLFLSCS